MRRIFYILSIILFTAIQSQGQARTIPSEDAAGPVIKFFPNPATTVITFDFQKGYDRGYDLQVFNFLGKLVTEQKNIAAKTSLNLTDYNRGVYVFRLVDKEGKIIDSGKFQVSK